MPPTLLRLDNFRQERNMFVSTGSTSESRGSTNECARPTEGHADRRHRRRARRAVLLRARPAARPPDRRPARDHGLGAQRRRRHVRLRRGVLRRDAGRHRARRPGDPCGDAGASSRVWDDIDVHFKGEVVTSGGHGFAAMSRRRLLEILQARCAELGVTVHFRTEAPDVDQLAASHDLVVACDGLNSAVRARYADTFRPTLDVRRLQVHVARHRQGLRRVQVLHPRDAARRDADPRLPVRRHRAARSSSR